MKQKTICFGNKRLTCEKWKRYTKLTAKKQIPTHTTQQQRVQPLIPSAAHSTDSEVFQ
jgi:hypothetical protein